MQPADPGPSGKLFELEEVVRSSIEINSDIFRTQSKI